MENKHPGTPVNGAENHGLESLQRSSEALTPVSLDTHSQSSPSTTTPLPTSSTSSAPSPNPLNLPPRKKPFLKKRHTLVAASLLCLTLILGLFALRLYGSVKKQASDSDVLATYQQAKLQALGVVKSEAVPVGSQKVSINGDLVVNEGIALSPDAINTISNSLVYKVNLNPAAGGPVQAGNIAVSGTILATTFQGNGSNLSNLNASALTSGTVSNDRLDPTITRLGQVIPISALSTGVVTTLNGVSSNAGNIDIEGQGGLSVTTDPTNNKIILTSSSGGDVTGVIAGTGLTGGGLSGDVTLNVDTGVVTVQGNTFNGINQLVKLNGAGELPVLSATNLTNLNASNINTGSLNDSRLSSNVTLQGNTFNLASKLVQLDSSGNLPALNGGAITGLNATNLSSGTVSDARLSANVALLGANQTFTGNVIFNQPLTVNTIQPSASMIIGATNQSLTLQGDLSTKLTASNAGNSVSLGFSGTPTGNIIYNLDAATTPGTYTLCTTVGNCASAGGGVTTLGGTTGKLTRFTGSQSIADSSISDTGSLVTVATNGLFKAGADSTTAFRVQQAATSNNVFTVDTTNTRVAIGQNTASYPLDVAGDINSTTGIRVGGNLVCDSTGCAAGSGSGFYIQNGTALQTAANINIESASTTSPTVVLKAKTSQTADILDAKDSTGATIASIDASGNINTTGQYKVNGAQISSTNLSNNANLAKLDGAQTFTAANTFKNATDSTAAFQIQNAAGSNTVLTADTSNNRVAIGKATAGYTLDVNGDVNINGGSSYRINGVAICGPTATCAPSSGSDGYVQNGLTLQTANFNIQSTQASGIVGIVQGAVGQTADLFQARDSSNAVLAKITSTGAIYQGASQVCDASNNCGYATSSGSGNYIQNSTISQTANMNIKSASANSVTSTIQGAAGQTANILEVKDGTSQSSNLLAINQTSGSLISNGSFETNTTGWTTAGSAVLTRTTAKSIYGNASLNYATTTASDSARYPVTLLPSTSYVVSFYHTANGTTPQWRAGYSPDGSTLNDISGFTTSTTSWGRTNYYFTTPSSVTNTFIYLRTISGTGNVIIDGVRLAAEGAGYQSAYSEGQISLAATIVSPVALRNSTDTTTAFQIQNASASATLVNADTLNSQVTITNSTNNPKVALLVGPGGGFGTTQIGSTLSTTVIDPVTQRATGVINGSSGYLLTESNFGVKAANAANTAMTIQGTAAQTADLLQVQGGNTSNSVLSVTQNNTNLITNPSFDTATTGWASMGSANGSRVTTEQYSGTGSMLITTTATANDGMRTGTITVAASTVYTLSFYAKTANTFGTMEYGTIASAVFTPCQTAQTVSSTWTRYSCTFTSAASTSAQVFVRQTDATIHAFYVDAFQLELGSTATNYRLGNINLNGTITSPTVFQNQSNSSNAFQIQNAAGEQVLSVDTTTTNQITNSSFEADLSGWSTVGTATASRSTAQGLFGNASMLIALPATADMVKYNFTFAPSTTYSMSFYAMSTLAAGQSWQAIYSPDGSTLKACTGFINATVIFNKWTRYSCTFTTPASISGTPFVAMYSPGATTFSMHLDGFQLEQAANASSYQQSQIKINGNITSNGVAFRNANNSTSAFSIQNANGSSKLLSADTINNHITLGGEVGSGTSFSGTDVLFANNSTNFGGKISARLNNTNLLTTANTGWTIQTSTGSSLAQNRAFEVIDQNSNQLLGLDISSAGNRNFISNPSFESSVSGWTGLTGTTAVRTTSDQYSGAGSMSITNTATANAGVRYNFTTAASTMYTLSAYVKAVGSSFSTLEIGYSDNGSTFTPCTSTATATTGWSRVSCTFTTGGSLSGTRFIYFRQTDATARTFFMDAVQLEATSGATNYALAGFSLNGTITSPAAFQNQADSTTAFQVQNAAGDKVLNIDTTTTNLVSNSSFEQDTAGWTARGGATIARSTAQKYIGDSSLAITYTTASGDGAGFTYALAPSTTYSLSMQVYMPIAGQYTSPMYSSDGTTTTPCSNNVPVINSWQRITCAFTTSSVSGSTYIGISKSFANAGTMYIDAVQLELGSAATSYRSAGISINGLVTSPLAIQAATNSNTALTVRSTDGTQVFGVDTSTSGVYANNITAGYGLNLRAGSGGYVALQSQSGVNYLSASGSGVYITPNGNSNFAVQSSTSGSTVIGADLTPSTTNLITNPSFDTNTTGWANFTGATLSRITTDQYSGTGSLSVVNTATAAAGAKINYNLAASTTYSFSLYAKATGSNFATFQIGYSADGATNTSCLTAQTVTTTGWTRYTCTFTTTTVSGTRYVYFAQTDGTARTFYVDAVQLEAAAAPTNYNLGNISLNGTVTSPTNFQNQSNSTSAFQVQNAAGTNILAVDTVNNTVKATSVFGAQNNQLNLGSTGTQQQFNVGSISQFGTVNFMDASQNNQVLTVNSTTTGVNLVGLGSNFSTGTGGFGADGAAVITRSTVDQYSGAGSLRVVTTAATNDGVKLAAAWVTGSIANSTTYSLSVYAKATGSNFSTFQMGYSNDGTTYTSCLTGTVTTTAWQRYTCSFTTSASGSGRFIYFRQTDATARTFYIDAVQLETGSVATGYSEGTITANGIFNSPAVFKNGSDSTTAFQIQNAAGTNLLTANTAGSALVVGTGLQVADMGVAKLSAGTLSLGTSVNGGNVAINAASGYGTIISGLTSGGAIDVLRVGSDNTAHLSNTSGTSIGIKVNPIFQPATGTGNFVGININPTINQTGSATGDYTALQIRPTVTAATGTNKLLIDAGTALNTGQLTMTDSGQFKLKNAADSTTAFDIQNSSGVSILSVDSTNMKVTVKDLAITGHIITTGSAPGVAVGADIGTSPGTPTISGNDTAGQVTIISGTSPTADGAMATITFNAAYAVAPKGVVLTPLNADSVAAGVFVTNIGTSSLTVRFHTPADGKSYQYSYLIVQ